MLDHEHARFQTDITIAFSLIAQRRPWIFRDLTNRDRAKAEAARAALISEVVAVVSDYELRKVPRPSPWPSTP